MLPQVLIVGSGPTGLVTALTLLKSGVSVRIIDKETAYNESSRGSGIYPRVQEIEHFLGTLPDVKTLSSPAPILHYYDPKNPRLLLRSTPMIEHIEAEPGFPINAPIMASQYLHEGVLRAHVEALGGQVELNTELSDIVQDGDVVAVKLTKSIDGKQEVEHATFPYVVGADGGRSTVRKLTGLQFLGETHETEMLLNADIDIKGFKFEIVRSSFVRSFEKSESSAGSQGFNMFGDPTSILIALRSTNIPERFQLIIAGPRYHEIAPECIEANLEELQGILTRLTGLSDLQITKIHTKTDWRLNVRMVDHFQKGKIFIAGDAAHVHSPMGGQGMTSGIQDAFNLAWKLALVVKGHASPALLTSYEEERLPVIGDMLLETSRLHRKVYAAKDDQGTVQTIQNTMDALGKAAAPRTKASGTNGGNVPDAELLFRGRKMFQLEINYRWSSIVLDERFAESGFGSERNAYGTVGGNVHAGDRAPDAPGLVVLFKNTELEKVGKVEGKQGESVRLFDIFDPGAHTILVFSADATLFLELRRALKRLPGDLVRTLLIVPSASSLLSGEGSGADLVLEDREGHAFRGYGVEGIADVVVVRPDGMIGAFVKGSKGVESYFTKVLGAPQSAHTTGPRGL
ncbi:hypothetical protein M0805_008441 [Coniferiporia weirii]|nr:hypothetical protein M0805_008441 [Coniferiporia weirii]